MKTTIDDVPEKKKDIESRLYRLVRLLTDKEKEGLSDLEQEWVEDAARDVLGEVKGEPLWDLQQVADYLNISRGTAEKINKENDDLSAVKVRSQWRFSPLQVFRYVEACRDTSPKNDSDE